jgi:hypothetical protein
MRQFRIRKALTTVPLGISGVYESGPINAEQYQKLTGKIFADQAGTLKILYADDEKGTYDALTSIAVAAGSSVKIDEPLYTSWLKVRYENNATTAQTVFRLSGYLNPFA